MWQSCTHGFRIVIVYEIREYWWTFAKSSGVGGIDVTSEEIERIVYIKEKHVAEAEMTWIKADSVVIPPLFFSLYQGTASQFWSAWLKKWICLRGLFLFEVYVRWLPHLIPISYATFFNLTKRSNPRIHKVLRYRYL